MKPRRFRDYIPLLILVLAQVFTLYVISTTSTVVNDTKFYIGIVAVIVCFAAMIINPGVGKWATVVTLLAGMIDLLQFLPLRITYGFTFNSIGPDFQAFPFAVLILFTILNWASIKRRLKWLLQEQSEPPQREG